MNWFSRWELSYNFILQTQSKNAPCFSRLFFSKSAVFLQKILVRRSLAKVTVYLRGSLSEVSKKKICSLTVRVLTQLRRTKKGSAGPNSKLLIFHHDSSKCLDLLLFWSVSFLCFLTASGWCGLKWTIDCSGQFPKIFVINESRVYRRQSIH